MAAGRVGLISQPSPSFTPQVPRAHSKKASLSPYTVSRENNQVRGAITSMPITSVVRHFPTSVLLQEQRNDPSSQGSRDYKQPQVTLDRSDIRIEELVCQDKDHELDGNIKYFKQQFVHNLQTLHLLSNCTEEKMPMQRSVSFITNDTKHDPYIEECSLVEYGIHIKPLEVLALAKEAMLASEVAVSLAESHSPMNTAKSFYFSSQGSNDGNEHAQETTRSKRFLERQSKQRRMPNKTRAAISVSAAMPTEVRKKFSKGPGRNDPHRLFFWGPDTKQLLSAKEEKDLFSRIQELKRLEEVKQKLQLQFAREPTLSEWAEAVGMTCNMLQSYLHSGNCSREKMIYSNFRLVVHVAKQYQGKGLDIQDLLQEGSMGLMRSLEKFKPTAGCKFPTYAYWWIRQSIRKAIFQNSRTIRLPENVYALLKKIRDIRRLYIQEGHVPSNEELARRVGITRERLEKLLTSSRNPVSIEDPAWLNQDVTFQEITADPEVEAPEYSVGKQMMRQHVRNLLRALPPRERKIIQLRYGIGGGEPKSLSDVGAIFRLSKERVRQLESRALERLKEGRGLDAYVHLLF